MALDTSQQGQAFRRAREQHGLSLDAVADDLLVRTDLLEAVEDGTINDVTAPAVAQAHRRVYARFLGFDAEAILAGEPPGAPNPASSAAELAATRRGHPRPFAPEPPPDADDSGPVNTEQDADVQADEDRDPDGEAELVAIWGAASPPPPPPPQPWWFRRSVMVVAAVAFTIGLLISIVLALTAGYGPVDPDGAALLLSTIA